MRINAIALVSGGLDSLLAANLIKKQGVEVIGLHYKIPFCKLNFRKNFPDIGIPLVEVDLSKEFLSLIHNPRYGFGSNMNPCIDCKILMFARTRELMDHYGAKFVITGEVLGQRPMSQNKQSLEIIKKNSGLNDLLLRPLSAGFFAPTLPERQGWVDRDKLLKFSGRIRRPQMELAKQMGIDKYSNPAGGCLLTDPEFSKRLRELISHDELDLDNLELLKLGRHFRVTPKTKLIVGRDEKENSLLLGLAKTGDYIFYANTQLAGPTCLLRGEADQNLIDLCCQITCSYCDIDINAKTNILYHQASLEKINTHETVCVSRNEFLHLRI